MHLRRSEMIAAVAAFVTVSGCLSAYAATAERRPTVDVPSVVWFTTDQDEVCGDYAWGCYKPQTPNVIYLVDSLKGSAQLAFVKAHEYAHFMQYRDGEPFSECLANDYALSVTGNVGMYEVSHGGPEHCDND